MRDFASRSERRLTVVAAIAMSGLFGIAAVALALVPLGTDGDSDCGTVVHSYVGWSRCGGARRYALGGVIALAAVAVLCIVVVVRSSRRAVAERSDR